MIVVIDFEKNFDEEPQIGCMVQRDFLNFFVTTFAYSDFELGLYLSGAIVALKPVFFPLESSHMVKSRFGSYVVDDVV